MQFLIATTLVLGPILAAMLFKKYLQESPGLTLEKADAMYSRVTLFMMGCLIGGGPLLMGSSSSDLGWANPITQLAAFVFAMTWMGVERHRYKAARSQALQQESPLGHAEHFIELLRFFAFMGVQVLIIQAVGLPGILLVVFATPLTVRIMFPSVSMSKSALRDQLEEVFKKANHPIKAIRIIQTQRKSRSNAMVCGSRFGFGPFRRTLFISQTLFELLEPDEILAVVHHEAAHFKLHHIPKRVGWVLLNIPIITIVATLITTFLSQVYSLLLLIGFVESSNGLLLAQGLGLLLAVLLQYHLIYQLIHRQEHEADLEAVKLGASSEALISALQKLTRVSGGENEKPKPALQRLMLTSGHPSLDERAAAIRRATLPSFQNYLQGWRPAVAAMAAMLAISLISLPKHRPTDRGPASDPAKLAHPKNSSSSR